MGKKKAAWRKAIDDSAIAEVIAKEGQERRREAGLATATDSELFFEDKTGRHGQRSSAAGGTAASASSAAKLKLKKTQLARSKMLKSLASLAKSDATYSGKPRREASIPKRKQKEFRDFLAATADKATKAHKQKSHSKSVVAAAAAAAATEIGSHRRDVWSPDEATTIAATSDDTAIISASADAIARSRDVKKLGRLNVPKQASSVNPDKEQFNQARIKVEAEAAKAEQKKALIRQKVPSEAVRSRLNMTSIDAGVDEILEEMQWANPAAGGMIQGDGGQQQEEEEDDDEEKPTDRPASQTRTERRTRREENKRRRKLQQQQELVSRQRIKKQRRDIAGVKAIVEAIQNEEKQIDEGIQQRHQIAAAKAHDALERQRDINGGSGGVYQPPKTMRKVGGAAAARVLQDRFVTMQMRGLVVKSAAGAQKRRKNRAKPRKTYIQGSKGWKEEETHKEALREKNMKAAIAAPALDVIQ